MSFLDYPFSKKENGDSRNFPGHEEVLRYLIEFANEFDLVGLIRFDHQVVRVEEMGQDWVVEWRNCDGELDFEVFDAVVICNGRHTEPKIAEFPGMDSWPGVQVHCHNYRTPEPFKDQIVVLIGNGYSAFDILQEIAQVAKEVHQASRAPNVQFGKLDGLDNAWLHSTIECAYEDGKVVFQDGSFVYANVILHCSGYKYRVPFLKTNGIVSVDDNRVGPLYKHVFPSCLAPKLAFVGLLQRVIPPVIIELQSKWVAKVLSGKIILPTQEEMNCSVQQWYQHMEETGLPKHYTHTFVRQKFDYENWLISEIGFPPLEKWREEVYFAILNSLITNPTFCGNYRDAWDMDEWIPNSKSSRYV